MIQGSLISMGEPFCFVQIKRILELKLYTKNLIKEGNNSAITLEAIGLLSGFPNRDSFRTAFQRIEGITPAVFISQKQG